MHVVSALEPRDAVESMLASQMVETHRAIMKAAQHLKHAKDLNKAIAPHTE